jgi:putative endonuclease
MFYVYVLLMRNKQFYTGFTDNLRRRMIEHNAGGNKTTKKFLPVKLIFYEAFINEADARRREEYLKTSKGKSTLRLMLREFITTTGW